MEVEARPWSHTMSKQPNVGLSNVTAEHSLGKGAVVKRKRGRPKKQTEASSGGSEGDVLTLPELTKRRLSDMCDDLGRLGKSSDVEQKRCILGEVLTLQELLTEGVGWFTIKPAVTIVALVRRRYSYHRCVDCWKKGVQNIEGKYCCIDHPEAETEEIYRLRVLLRQGDMWVTAFDEVAEAILGVTVKKFSAFDDDGRKRVAGGVSGMKCYMTIQKTHGVYTNYTVESMEPAGYLY